MKKSVKLSLMLSCSLFVNLSAQVDIGAGSSAQSDPCISSASPWFIGGNNLTANTGINPSTGLAWYFPPVNDIGTCNKYPFILKADNFHSVFIQPNGFIGINNPNPGAALDVKSPVLGSSSSFKIYGDPNGNLESSTDINLNYATSHNLYFNEGPANGSVNRMMIANGGNVGIGTSSPNSKLEVTDASNTDICAFSTNTNGTAGLWSLNGSTNYGLNIDANGVGHISQNKTSPLNLVNFSWNTGLTTPKGQVWIGKRPTIGNHVDFDLAAPKIVAKEIYVFDATGNWADYVFANDYKLPKLTDIETYYKKNHHLPEVPTTKEVNENGINLSQMNTLLLKKIEELTIHLVELNKEVQNLKSNNK